jgi:signal peptidase I
MSDFQIEPYNLSSWAKENRYSYCFIYRGPSMIPTFRTGDFLYVHANVQMLFPGDVIVFTTHKITGYIVHRIVSISKVDFITRGDHNRLPDNSTITLEKIIGRVEYVENKRGIHRVANGKAGVWEAKMCQLAFGLDRIIRRLFWTPYHFIRERRFVGLFWQPKISKMHFRVKSGQLIKYVYRNRTVAIWDNSCQRFDCRKPFDLIIPNPEESK